MKIISVIDHSAYGDEYLTVACRAAPYVDIIWYRIRNETSAEILKRSKRLRAMAPNVTMVLSERADLALAADFQGVHLNDKSPDPREIKRCFPSLIVGYSAHSIKECASSAADYVVLSPIFDSNKPYGSDPLGLVKAPRDEVYAMGGVNSKNYRLLYGKGFAGIAGIRLSEEADKFQIR